MKLHSGKHSGPRLKFPYGLVIGVFLSGSASVSAVDHLLKPVADGSQSYRGDVTNDGSDWALHAEYAESSSIYSSGRRILLKFDTSSLSATQMRSAKLYMFGGCGKDTPVLTKVYKYSNDEWNDNNVPYPHNGYLQYLAEKMVSNVKTADYIGSSEWHAYDIGSALSGWESDGYLSIAMRNLTPNPPYKISSASFISRNSVTWNGSVGKEPYLAFETWIDAGVVNSGFTSSLSSLDRWKQLGAGTASLIVDPDDAANRMVELTAGSAISISQVLDTPEDPFYIRLRYEFKNLDGSLDVSLTDRDGVETVVGSLMAPDVQEPGLKSKWLRVETPSLLAADNVTLKLTFDGESGSQMWIDEVVFSMESGPSAPAGFRITSVSVMSGAGQLQLTWNSEPSATYMIEGSPDLAAASWPEVASDIPSQGSTTTHMVPMTSNTRRFFRVVKQP